jgi:hypothetical protein
LGRILDRRRGYKQERICTAAIKSDTLWRYQRNPIFT